MKKHFFFAILSVVLSILFSLPAFSATQAVRWTGFEDKNSELTHVLQVIREKTGFNLGTNDFQMVEDRDLAHQHFRMLLQTAGGVPIRRMAIRIWTELNTGQTVQIEALLEDPAKASLLAQNLKRGRPELSSEQTMKLVRAAVNAHRDDRQIRSVDWDDAWQNGKLVRIAKIKARRGIHTVVISLSGKRVVENSYEYYPQADSPDNGEFSVPVQVFPIYEEVETTGELTQRIPAELKYIRSWIAYGDADPYQALRHQRYLEEKYDPVLGEMPSGREKGYWAMNYVKRQAAAIAAGLPSIRNDFNRGVVLSGRYTTVSVHPDAIEKFQSIAFAPKISSVFKPTWKLFQEEGSEGYEMLPISSYWGRPITSHEDAMNRPARRLPDHDPATYLNDGFDEIQVYYAVNALFDSLRGMGFTDPELSTRPFNAFLYDPDIEMRDNAFYTDDTINFTTYSSKSINFARDNSTVWHELGHGVMDRLMGDMLRFADTGGLSEGIADLIAEFVIQDLMGGLPFPGSSEFRIINKTGFYLTNEVHDDGEAYGGAMRDLELLAISRFGRAGLVKVADLVLESMRLCRNHPALTANEWFNHMLFADQLGNGQVRAPGELGALVTEALNGRNFDLSGARVASFTLRNGGDEVTSRSLGSRGNPIPLTLSSDETGKFELTAEVKNGASYSFKFPVTVKVMFQGGALEGAVHWVGEEKGPLTMTLNSESELAAFELEASGRCDYVNREDGSCVDYAYVQIWNAGETERPQAKKRFYVRVQPAQE